MLQYSRYPNPSQKLSLSNRIWYLRSGGKGPGSGLPVQPVAAGASRLDMVEVDPPLEAGHFHPKIKANQTLDGLDQSLCRFPEALVLLQARKSAGILSDLLAEMGQPKRSVTAKAFVDPRNRFLELPHDRNFSRRKVDLQEHLGGALVLGRD